MRTIGAVHDADSHLDTLDRLLDERELAVGEAVHHGSRKVLGPRHEGDAQR
ncbi:hypothetical protein D3C74_471880 [compost metagenome]